MSSKIKFGKHLIESLTIGMYQEHNSIYREYVQNAADQIDKAVDLKLVKNRRKSDIYITINQQDKRIEIYDNATGIKQEEVFSLLGDVAKSEKDRNKNKGFRGIGRLGGLAYCDTLVFETSYKDEETKSIFKWDAKRLKEIIGDQSNKENADEVLVDIVSHETLPEEPDQHYFKVSLLNVRQQSLLQVEQVKEYLSLVAPVPFPSSFIYSEKIKSIADKYDFTFDEYNIYVNGEVLYKPYKTDIFKMSGSHRVKQDEILDIDKICVKNNNEVMAWGWYSITQFNGQINEIPNYYRGIHYRKSNIEIGDASTLVTLHVDKRFNYYFIGEIHILSPKLVPNARRDDFQPTDDLDVFHKQLKQIFHTELDSMIRQVVDVRSISKSIDKLHSLEDEFSEKQKKGFINKNEKSQFEQKIDDARKSADKAVEKIIDKCKKLKDTKVGKVIDKVLENQNINTQKKPMQIEGIKKPTGFITDKLSKLNKKERKLVSDIFEIIKNVLPPDQSKVLMEKIEEKLK